MKYEDRVAAVMGAFESAQNESDYHCAKASAGRLSLTSQFKLIDNAIAARKKLMAKGVL